MTDLELIKKCKEEQETYPINHPQYDAIEEQIKRLEAKIANNKPKKSN